MVLAFRYGGRGEVVNAPDCGSGIREFDSHRPPQITVKTLVNQGFFFLFKNKSTEKKKKFQISVDLKSFHFL